MFSIIYPNQPDLTVLIPYMEGLTEKQRVILISTYSHIQSMHNLPKEKAIQYTMMIVMKHKYDHLMYSPEIESTLTHLVKA